MASIQYPIPGTPLRGGRTAGPCEGGCTHRDCAETRVVVALLCPGCRKPIGYDRAFLRYRGSEWHEECAMEDAEEATR